MSIDELRAVSGHELGGSQIADRPGGSQSAEESDPLKVVAFLFRLEPSLEWWDARLYRPLQYQLVIIRHDRRQELVLPSRDHSPPVIVDVNSCGS